MHHHESGTPVAAAAAAAAAAAPFRPVSSPALPHLLPFPPTALFLCDLRALYVPFLAAPHRPKIGSVTPSSFAFFTFFGMRSISN
jgi:hypothetical protein